MTKKNRIINILVFIFVLIIVIFTLLTFSYTKSSSDNTADYYYGKYIMADKTRSLNIDSTGFLKIDNDISTYYEYKFVSGLFVIYEKNDYVHYLPINDNAITCKNEWSVYFKYEII